MEKCFTVAAIGLGNRGHIYLSYMMDHPDQFKIVALCDKDANRLALNAKDFSVPEDKCFTDENLFFAEKPADVCIVATQDRDHVGHAIKALALGCDLLLEKPISPSEEECRELLKAQKKYGGKVFVCHVLRYAPAFLKVKELLDAGTIGELVMIDSIEQVSYFHQAHSFVRGNWRRKDETSPMILAKCCHDLDLLQYYAGSKADTVSSIGDLRYFKKENAPEGATERCFDCPHVDTCVYSAKYYITGLDPESAFRYIATEARPVTDEALAESLKTNCYGRCVYFCDNDVVDNEMTMIRFENGITANLRMTAFTKNGGRVMKFYGSLGEIVLDEEQGYLDVKCFGKDQKRTSLSDLTEKGYMHGGGDSRLINALHDMLTGEANGATTLSSSIESHLMAFAAEESRLAGGKVVKVRH